MTSKEHIESLRRHGVRLIGWDGTTKEIPADFLETTTKMLNSLRSGTAATQNLAAPMRSSATQSEPKNDSLPPSGGTPKTT